MICPANKVHIYPLAGFATTPALYVSVFFLRMSPQSCMLESVWNSLILIHSILLMGSVFTAHLNFLLAYAGYLLCFILKHEGAPFFFAAPVPGWDLQNYSHLGENSSSYRAVTHSRLVTSQLLLSNIKPWQTVCWGKEYFKVFQWQRPTFTFSLWTRLHKGRKKFEEIRSGLWQKNYLSVKKKIFTLEGSTELKRVTRGFDIIQLWAQAGERQFLPKKWNSIVPCVCTYMCVSVYDPWKMCQNDTLGIGIEPLLHSVLGRKNVRKEEIKMGLFLSLWKLLITLRLGIIDARVSRLPSWNP